MPTPNETVMLNSSPTDGSAPRVQVRVDDRERPTEYINAFLTMTTAEEVMLDVGVNAASAISLASNQPAMDLKLSSRLAMNYFTAKRLAISLSRTIREYEGRFGEIELDGGRRANAGRTSGVVVNAPHPHRGTAAESSSSA